MGLTIPSKLMLTIAYEDYSLKIRHFEEHMKIGKQWYFALHNDMDVEMFHVWGGSPNDALAKLLTEAETFIDWPQHGIGREAENQPASPDGDA